MSLFRMVVARAPQRLRADDGEWQGPRRVVAKPARNPHISLMTPFSESDEAKARRATLLARKMSQLDEGRTAMDEYHRSHEATLERTAKLRALRLAQQALPVEAKPEKAKKPTRQPAKPKKLAKPGKAKAV
jgi:hypothetical protein